MVLSSRYRLEARDNGDSSRPEAVVDRIIVRSRRQSSFAVCWWSYLIDYVLACCFHHSKAPLSQQPLYQSQWVSTTTIRAIGSSLRICLHIPARENHVYFVSGSKLTDNPGFTVLFARLSDITGRKSAFLMSLCIFTTTSLACALSKSLTELYYPSHQISVNVLTGCLEWFSAPFKA